jgi:hypothetical protein
LGGESKGKEPRRVHAYIPQKFPRKMALKPLQKKSPRKGSENHQKGKSGRTQTSLE